MGTDLKGTNLLGLSYKTLVNMSYIKLLSIFSSVMELCQTIIQQ